ncbi:MAG: hypothetical protein AB7T49_18540 [Oligoflexales bacterium]
MKKAFLNEGMLRGAQTGGAAIEYIIVSIFAIVVAAGGITLVSKAIKKQIEEIQQKYGIEIDADWPVF